MRRDTTALLAVAGSVIITVSSLSPVVLVGRTLVRRPCLSDSPMSLDRHCCCSNTTRMPLCAEFLVNRYVKSRSCFLRNSLSASIAIGDTSFDTSTLRHGSAVRTMTALLLVFLMTRVNCARCPAGIDKWPASLFDKVCCYFQHQRGKVGIHFGNLMTSGRCRAILDVHFLSSDENRN